MKKKTIVTITGIRPDFIRMKNVFREFDKRFNHIMIHTGQHYDDELSKVFFQELDIRWPDYTLSTGKSSSTQYQQLAYLAENIVPTLKEKNIEPDLIVFLGDSHSALAAIPLFKEGYKIAHIEGGMRSYDRRMPEEVNRVCCDYVSDLVFVYTPLYKERLLAENKPEDGIFVVGNTITEIVHEHMPKGERAKDYILADIHRNENLSSVDQYEHILKYLNRVGEQLEMPVKLVKFNRAVNLAGDLYDKYSRVEVVGPYGFLDYMKLQYNSYGIISDSGTAQEEPALFGVPVAVPRLATERPESVENGCSVMVGESDPIEEMAKKTIDFFKQYSFDPSMVEWLGDGKTSGRIADILEKRLK